MMVCALPQKIQAGSREIVLDIESDSGGTNGNATYCYVQYAGTKYYTMGDTFVVTPGSTLSLHAGRMISSIMVDGVSCSTPDYNYTIPTNIRSIHVIFSYSTNYSYIVLRTE